MRVAHVEQVIVVLLVAVPLLCSIPDTSTTNGMDTRGGRGAPPAPGLPGSGPSPPGCKAALCVAGWWAVGSGLVYAEGMAPASVLALKYNRVLRLCGVMPRRSSRSMLHQPSHQNRTKQLYPPACG